MRYDNLKLEKELYMTSKSFAEALEELDPSENYKGTELEGLDAYERQLKRFGIKLSGPDSSTVEAFFKTTDSTVLFPEYISRTVQLGICDNNLLDKIIASTTVINSYDYRSIEYSDKEDNVDLKTKESLVKMNKIGNILNTSYEAIKYQRLELFSIILKQIGISIARRQLDDAVKVIYNTNKKIIKSESLVYTIDYDDLINLYAKIDPYRLTALITSNDCIAKILKFQEFRDNMDYNSEVLSIMGANVVNSSLMGDSVLGIDSSCTLEKVTVGAPVIVDGAKLIDRQFEHAQITAITGFSRITDDSSILLEI